MTLSPAAMRQPHLRFGLAAIALTLSLSTPVSALQAQSVDWPLPKIKIESCKVESELNANIKQDCTAIVAEKCNGIAECELNIGYHLTLGKDIDAAAGLLGKMVSVRYDCADGLVRQRGPYSQSDHATLTLDCTMS